MKSFIKLLTLAVIFSTIIISCSDDDNTVDNNGKVLIESTSVISLETFKIVGQDTSAIVYYSLRENKVIDKSLANTDKWDVAFNKTSIYVNQGFRGPGNGGAFVMRETDFETLAELPADSTFYLEVAEVTKAIPTGTGKGWYNYDMTSHEISPIPGVVIAIKTADGKYAKMKILNYYEGYPDNIPADPNLRNDKFYSFKFVFQPDGTKSFKK